MRGALVQLARGRDTEILPLVLRKLVEHLTHLPAEPALLGVGLLAAKSRLLSSGIRLLPELRLLLPKLRLLLSELWLLLTVLRLLPELRLLLIELGLLPELRLLLHVLLAETLLTKALLLAHPLLAEPLLLLPARGLAEAALDLLAETVLRHGRGGGEQKDGKKAGQTHENLLKRHSVTESRCPLKGW